MRLFRSQVPSSPAHWSKEFVEHLRTVHFALVTVSVGLMLLLTSQQYDPKAAAKQLQEVQTIAYELDHIDVSTSEPEWAAFFDTNKLKTYGQEMNVGLASWFSAFSVSERKVVIFQLPGPYFCDDLKTYRAFPPPLPTRVSAVAALWDKMPFVVDKVFSTTSQGEATGTTGPVLITGFSTDPDAATKKTPEAELVTFQMEGPCGADNTTPKLTVGRPVRYTFPVVKVRRKRVKQSDYRYQRKAFRDFDDSFPDLSAVAADAIDDSFDKIEKRLEVESEKEEQTFEAFGIKFRSTQVTRWGIVVLLGVQLYLVMYLRQFSKKLNYDDPGWDMPWMAMDQSMLARTMLFISLVLLPTCAALVVVIQAERSGQRVEMILMPLGLVASLVLAVLSWQFRPKLTEPVAPAQLFE